MLYFFKNHHALKLVFILRHTEKIQQYIIHLPESVKRTGGNSNQRKLTFLKIRCPHTVNHEQNFVKKAEYAKAVFSCGMIH